MEIAFFRLDERVARFIISGVSTSFANMLRRAMISEVPTLAIEDVRIYDNTSVIFDEMLAHRLGLIPLRTDLARYAVRSECSCGGAGCPVCTATYTLSVEGPKTVYSSDLISQDPDAAPAEGSIPIIDLGPEQKIVLEAHAIVGTGKEHAKWQATTACGYKNYPAIAVDERCDGCGMCIDECPRDARGGAGQGSGRQRAAGALFALQALRTGVPCRRHRHRAGHPDRHRTGAIHLRGGERRIDARPGDRRESAPVHSEIIRRPDRCDKRYNGRGD